MLEQPPYRIDWACWAWGLLGLFGVVCGAVGFYVTIMMMVEWVRGCG